MANFTDEEMDRLLLRVGHLYQPCISCTHPMLGILKESACNAHEHRVARDSCWICDQISKEQARFDRTGSLN